MEYISDDEQVEQIKKWWKENGNSVIFGIVIGIGGIMGWRYWGDYQTDQSAQASAHFEAMLGAVENKQFDQAEKSAMAINNDFSSTPYSTYAQLTLAKIQFEQAKYDQAEKTLNSIIEDNKADSIEFIARKRLADVYIDQKKYDQALSTLAVEFPSSFQAAFEERKGDIYRYQGKVDEANSAYLLAKVANHAVEDGAFLQQKMDELGR